jgi:uncharacterized protein (TIGR02996 family)
MSETCPRCGSHDLRGGKASFEDGALYDYRCFACGLSESMSTRDEGFSAWRDRWFRGPVAATLQRPPELDGLRRDLHARPDSWEGWLVLADWLTDQGDVRGDLTRLEHRLATKPLSEEERARLGKEIAELVAKHRSQWLDGWSCPEATELQWRHGFVWGVRFRDRAGSIEALKALVAHPSGYLLSELSLERTGFDDEDVQELVHSGVLRTLRLLNLRNCGLTREATEQLVRSASLRGCELVLSEEG